MVTPEPKSLIVRERRVARTGARSDTTGTLSSRARSRRPSSRTTVEGVDRARRRFDERPGRQPMAPSGACSSSPNTPPMSCAPSSRARLAVVGLRRTPSSRSGRRRSCTQPDPEAPDDSRRGDRGSRGSVEDASWPLRQERAWPAVRRCARRADEQLRRALVDERRSLGPAGCRPVESTQKRRCHARLTPPAPGAPHDTTSYVPADAAGAPSAAVAATTTAPANPRIPALITRQCSSIRRCLSAARVRPRCPPAPRR